MGDESSTRSAEGKEGLSLDVSGRQGLLGGEATITRQIEQRLAEAHLIGVDSPRSGGQSTTIRFPFFVAIGSIVLATSSITCEAGIVLAESRSDRSCLVGRSGLVRQCIAAIFVP